jgi:tetratricopeptide (TPR) repeat protein
MFTRFVVRLKAIPGRYRRCLVVAIGLLLVAGFCSRWVYAAWQIRQARQNLSDTRPVLALEHLRQLAVPEAYRAEKLFLLGRASRRAGQLESAAAYLEQAEQAGWTVKEVRLQQNLLLVQTGNFQQAGDLLKEILVTGTDDDTAEEIYEARAKGFYSTFRLGDALVCLNYWLNWRPHVRQARIWRAEIFERTTRTKEAVEDYRAVVQRDPDDVEVRLRLGAALLELNETRSALEEFETCLAKKTADADAQIGRLKCLRRLGELANVSETLSTLLDRELKPGQRGSVLRELGEMALYQQDYARAVEYLKQARQVDPVNCLVYAPLRIAYSRLGLADLAEAEKRRGEEATARSNRLSEITQAVLQDSLNADLRYEAGMILVAEGLKSEGAAWLKTAVECDPTHVKAHAALADYYDDLGDLAAAQRHRRLALVGAGREHEEVDPTSR